MPKIQLTERFKKCYLDLDKNTRKKVDKAIRFLAEDPRHPSLRCKSIQGAPGIYEASADLSYRMTFERLPNDVLRLRVVGKHDEALNNP